MHLLAETCTFLLIGSNREPAAHRERAMREMDVQAVLVCRSVWQGRRNVAILKVPDPSTIHHLSCAFAEELQRYSQSCVRSTGDNESLLLSCNLAAHLLQQSQMLLWTKAGQYACAGQNVMEPKPNSTVSPNLLPDVARFHKQSNERIGPTQIHLCAFNVGVTTHAVEV